MQITSNYQRYQVNSFARDQYHTLVKRSKATYRNKQTIEHIGLAGSPSSLGMLELLWFTEYNA